MTTYFITRHPGAIEWARHKGVEAEQLEHLDVQQIKAGDIVMGTLPVSLVAEVNQRGARYLHLVLEIPSKDRGQELTAADMERLGAELVEYTVKRIKNV